MPGQWDDIMKRLLREHPEDFVAWIVPGGRILAKLSENLKTRDRQTDGLFRVASLNELILTHFEFQRRNDYNMAERLLEYNVLASNENSFLPVISCVIYLCKDGNVAESPFIRRLPDGQEILRFHFKTIKLWEIPAEVLLAMGLPGLLPPLFLTQNGKQPEVVTKTVTELGATGESELLILGYMIGSMVFEDETERKILKRRFAMFEDMLRDTWAFKEIMEEGYEKGMERGMKWGIEQGIERERQRRVQDLHQILTSLVQTHFPGLVSLAQQQIDFIQDPLVLQNLMLKLVAAQTVEEAREALLNKDGKSTL